MNTGRDSVWPWWAKLILFSVGPAAASAGYLAGSGLDISNQLRSIMALLLTYADMIWSQPATAVWAAVNAFVGTIMATLSDFGIVPPVVGNAVGSAITTASAFCFLVDPIIPLNTMILMTVGSMLFLAGCYMFRVVVWIFVKLWGAT
jgi:hypothetical protein